ncbi:MAG: purine-nucleoside phosphorylase [Chloroflexota bacterium]|nr:MAG: purine-nucleoside phosphorylase [Chloroflexota bacterium]UCF28778.1 MAG: purine-nucleoside phosphorylase [Chloroflexota bacterium]
MNEFITLEQIDRAVDTIRGRITNQPKVGMILGSGLGSLAESVEDAVFVPYSVLPPWPVSTVEGHEGRLVIGSLENQEVMVMQGRSHYYEGYSMPQIGFPVRVMQRLGVEILIVTNAAGAVNPDFEPGEVMLITDHLNLLGMAGESPLRGPNFDQIGPRFPDMGFAYDRKLGELTRQVAKESGFALREGVYVCLAGPSFETPADLRFLKAIGVDAVGMSTVPEVTVAVHGGMRALGLSTISNKANLDGETITSHEEVLEAGKIVLPRLTQIVTGVLQRL